MARMTSRFSGTCRECRCSIAAGDPIDYDRATKRVTCADCAPPIVPSDAAPAVVRVSVVGSELAMKLDGHLGDKFSAFRGAVSGCRFRDGVNYLPVLRAPAVILAIRAAGINLDVSREVQSAIDGASVAKSEAVSAATQRTAAVDAILAARGGSLYPYQREGVAWLAPRSGALIADDMGLGKTIQALTAIPDGAPVIVVCPAVAKSVWEREAAKWRPEMRVTVLSGRGSFRAPAAGEMVCINYDILSDADPCLLPGTVLILDEAHACASHKSLRTKRVKALSEAARSGGGKCWALTATPLKTRPTELWGVLEIAGLGNEAFGGWMGFVRAFNGYKGRFGYEFGRPSDGCADMLRRVSLRRRKVDVLKDLPAKTYRVLPAEIDRATAKMCDEALGEVGGENDAQSSLGIEKAVAKLMSTGLGFSQLSAARAALAKAKIPAMLEVVESYEEQNEPLVVFSAYRAPIDLLAKRDGWAVITGDTSNDERGSIVERFQAGNLKGVACTIRAGGVAITLTRASNVLRVDREWNPALNVQAEDRCYRIGQSSAVLVTDLVANHKLDEMIASTLAKKEALIGGSVEASTVVNVAPEAVAPEVDWTVIEADAAKAAHEAVEAAKAAMAVEGENAKKRAQKKAAMARVEAQARVRKAAARRLAEVESEEDAPRRGPSNEVESWAISGLRQLAESDPDRAHEKNGVGFNSADGGIGHALAWLPDLTDQEWRLALRIAKHYQGQIGTAPSLAA